MSPSIRDWRWWLLAIIPVALWLGLAMQGPIAQDPAYHLFMDDDMQWGIPNAWNVLSNLPFLIAGMWGLAILSKDRALGAPLRAMHIVFFLATAMIAFGSAYYHAEPGDARLVWDRLPMALAFMALFAAVVGVHLSATLARRAFVPLLALGLSTVLWWRFQGDLRPYLFVQFLPVLTIPAILVLFPRRTSGAKYLWWTLGAYVLAKVFEIYDADLYITIGVGGHALKHIAAAIGIGFVARALRAGW